MTKPGDSRTKKTLHELAKEFPEKSYRELEKYRDADRQEEAGVCIIGEARKDREYEKEHKLRQEAEGELTILKGIETNRVKEAQARSWQLQDELDKVKKENNDLYNKIADLTESLKSKDYFEKPDYQYLIEENRRLEQEKNELLTEKKKMIQIVEDKIKQAREAGL